MIVRELVYKYINHTAEIKRRRLKSDYQTYLGRLLDEDLHEIKKHQLEGHLAKTASLASATITNTLLVRLFSYAVEGNFIEPAANPALNLSLPKARTQVQSRDLSEAEIQRVMSAIRGLRSRPARQLLLLITYTDLRMAEAKRLRWSEVCLPERRLYLGSRIVELSEEAVAFIRSIKPIAELVIPSLRNHALKVSNTQKAWEMVREKTGLDIRIDDLRKYKSGE